MTWFRLAALVCFVIALLCVVGLGTVIGGGVITWTVGGLVAMAAADGGLDRVLPVSPWAPRSTQAPPP